MRSWLILLLLATALPATAQTVEPDPIGPVKAIGVRRFEASLVYGFAVFTNSQSGTEWTEAAPRGTELDLDTSPSLGLGFAWSAGENLRLGLRATHQATRLLASDADTTSRTDMTLLHLQLEIESTFGHGRVRPLVALAGGGSRVNAGGAMAWHYSAVPTVGLHFAVDRRVVLRALARLPLIWANGNLVVQQELAAGMAWRF